MAERYPEAELVLDDELLFDDAPRRSTIARRDERAEDIVREGEVLAGKYRVERIPGRNGLGVLVQVRHLELGQEVTLKFLVPEACAYPEFVQRFVREARAAVRIQGEHVARVTDVGRLESGAPYMVREYLRGPDLAEVLKVRGPLPVAEAVDYIVQAAEGVAEGHALGVVHRNLRPTSLVVVRRSDGTALVKVFDFAASETLHVNPFTERAVSLVGTSAIMASLPYLAPEQIRDPHDVDFRADIYSLGAVLFELLTGSPVYSADAAPALLAQVAADPAPSLRNARPELSGELDHIVLRCLAKNRAIRYSSLSELVLALKPFASPEMVISIERIQRLGARTSKLPPTNDGHIPLSPPSVPPPSRPRVTTQPLPPVAVSSPRVSVHDDVTTINPYATRLVPPPVPPPAREPAVEPRVRTSAPPPLRHTAPLPPVEAKPTEVVEAEPRTLVLEPSVVIRDAPAAPREPVAAPREPVAAAREPSAAPRERTPTPPPLSDVPPRRHESTMIPPRTSISGMTRSWAAPEEPAAPLFTPRRLATLGAVAAGVTLAAVGFLRSPGHAEPVAAAHSEPAKVAPAPPPAAPAPLPVDAAASSASAAAAASAPPAVTAPPAPVATVSGAPAPVAPASVAPAPTTPAPARPALAPQPARVVAAPVAKATATPAPARQPAPVTEAVAKPAPAPKLASATTGDLFDGPK